MLIPRFFLIFAALAALTGAYATEPPSNSCRGDLGETSQQLNGERFNIEREFPRLFLPPQYYAHSTPVPKEVLDKSFRLLQRAVASQLHRLTIRIATPEGIKNVRYFEHLESLLPKDFDGRILASGGLVRSAISRAYELIYRRWQVDPSVDPWSTLMEIRWEKDDLNPIEIRSIGGDLDVLVESSSGSPTRAETLKTVRALIAEVTQSLETHFDATRKGESEAIHRSLFAIGDVKDFREQTREAVSSGGSTADHLAFAIKDRAFVDPPQEFRRTESIVKDLILGRYRYLRPARENSPRYPTKQTIRGVRTLLELPWLQLAEPQRLQFELDSILESLTGTSSPQVDSKSIEQFHKMIRNQRYGGANNRMHRATPGSIEAKALEISNRVSPAGRPLIPEFADEFPLDQKIEGELSEELKPYLMSYEEFVANHTDEGTIYHGTPEIENSLAILRGGFFLSKSNQGIAAFGRGVYTSQLQQTASAYAGHHGIVFELGVKSHPKLKILDYERFQKSPLHRQLIAQNRDRPEFDLFAYLARHEGIDIIINHHVLVQNAAVLSHPKRMDEIVKAYIRQAASPNQSLSLRTKTGIALLSYEGLVRHVYPDFIEAYEQVLSDLARELSTKPTSQTELAERLALIQDIHTNDKINQFGRLIKTNGDSVQWRALLEKYVDIMKSTHSISFALSPADFEALLEIPSLSVEERIARLPRSFNLKEFFLHAATIHSLLKEPQIKASLLPGLISSLPYLDNVHLIQSAFLILIESGRGHIEIADRLLEARAELPEDISNYQIPQAMEYVAGIISGDEVRLDYLFSPIQDWVGAPNQIVTELAVVAMLFSKDQQRAGIGLRRIGEAIEHQLKNRRLFRGGRSLDVLLRYLKLVPDSVWQSSRRELRFLHFSIPEPEERSLTPIEYEIFSFLGFEGIGDEPPALSLEERLNAL